MNLYVSARYATYGLRIGAGVWRIRDIFPVLVRDMCTHMGYVTWHPPGIRENRPSVGLADQGVSGY